MEPETLDKILKSLKKANVAEFSLKTNNVELSIRFESSMTSVVALQPAPIVAAPTQAAPPSAPPQVAPPPKAVVEVRAIKAPIVGTFYRAPSPDAAPYVKVGDSVRKGQVVCIVEAMKLMNQIESDADGTIAEILLENGQPVQFGQELFRLS
jgi:acetyl-CoA carboxylase biotin carboxyl carrier protein